MLKLNIGVSKKIGEANYGSRGASTNLELELESGLIDQADRLKERIRQLFVLAKESVDEELAREPAPPSEQTNSQQANGAGRRQHSARQATASQVRAIRAIVERQQLDLADVLKSRFSIDNPEDLSITQASQLIDELKAHANGNGAGGRR